MKEALPNTPTVLNFKFSFLCFFSVGILSLLPGKQLPQTDIQYADLFVHVILYALLTWIVFWELAQFVEINWRYSMASVLLIIVFGGIMEILQENLVQGRFGSWSDFSANAFGCLSTLFLKKKILRKS